MQEYVIDDDSMTLTILYQSLVLFRCLVQTMVYHGCHPWVSRLKTPGVFWKTALRRGNQHLCGLSPMLSCLAGCH